MKERAKIYYEAKKKKLSDYELRKIEEIPFDIEKIKKIHLSAVCGTAMGSLAKLFKDGGYEISGSDKACYPPMDNVIKNLGVDLALEFKENHIENADITIIGNMLPAQNIEAKYARENKKLQLSMSDAINNFFIKDKKSIVITGTHGKTTTTGLCINTFLETGIKPSYLVGGVMKNTDDSAKYDENSKYFIIEGDEYDTAYFDKSPKFLHYKPDISVITSIELDHIDIYESLEDYTNAFRFLIEETSTEGKIFICDEDFGARMLADEYKNDSRILKYGLSESCDIFAKNIEITDLGQTFEVIFMDKNYGEFSTPLFGTYNLLNSLAVAGIAILENIEIEKIKNALISFKNMKRRQEVFAEKNGIIFIDDFAHHPTAVTKTLRGIKEHYKDKRIVALFEPRSNTSRSKMFEEEYGLSFKDADLVVISAPKEKEGYNPEAFMDMEKVINEINKYTEAYSVSNSNEVLKLIKPKLKSGDVVVIMSNGSFDGIHQKLIDLF